MKKKQSEEQRLDEWPHKRGCKCDWCEGEREKAREVHAEAQKQPLEKRLESLHQAMDQSPYLRELVRLSLGNLTDEELAAGGNQARPEKPGWQEIDVPHVSAGAVIDLQNAEDVDALRAVIEAARDQYDALQRRFGELAAELRSLQQSIPVRVRTVFAPGHQFPKPPEGGIPRSWRPSSIVVRTEALGTMSVSLVYHGDGQPAK